ncbi:MAG: glycosyl hydrolase [Acidobacteria bacterium]|nr:glycosyl hydrolase [Acidobacteriota bacterium]MBI3425117.1 glycosyl hydrolase [Acidobacteriota bacterium]
MQRTFHPARSLTLLALGALIALGSAAFINHASSHAQETKPASPFTGLRYRNIGPFRGGRSVAVTGVASQPNTYYFGSVGGGVFKSTDGGDNWVPVSDGQPFGTGTVGALAVSESDPNIVFAGMGEACIRGNFSHGDGVYKSVDAGKTWARAGLADSRIVGKIRIHPKNPDIVFVAALGHAAGANDERGVFRSKDGGKTWQRVLFKSNKAGVVDLSMDPSNPNVLYAAIWEAKRTPYSLESGGPDSGLWKSTDGGDNWTDISRAPGLPRGILGKIGVAVSPANPERVYACVEAEDGGVFSSSDAGRTWTKVSTDRNLRQRAWYYTHIVADPKNVDGVYVLNVGFHKSIDGGRTYTQLNPPHGDNHDMWIAPDDPNRMITSNDGGANVSFDGGRRWSEQDQATGQYYRVATDNDFPYHVYGAQQDSSTVRIASRTTGFGITDKDWDSTAGSESGWVQPSPKDSMVVFGGNYGGLLERLDHRTGQSRDLNVWPDNPMGWGVEGMKYRFQWNFPILFSPHDQNVLYTGGSHLFKSTNEGQSWQIISDDLTRNDKSKQGSSGGPITKDNTSVEYYCTIFTLAESSVTKGVMWTGSDDGLVHVTRDCHAAKPVWENVTKNAPGLPEWAQINSIEASPHDAATAYFAATLYKADDFHPYLYKTSDYGKTWKKIVTGIPDNAFTRVIREDPHRRGLLYAGTETGMYISFNDGDSWQAFQLNLPVVPITDLTIHKRDKDLVVATQGRAFWILDDLTVLHQWPQGNNTIADVHLFKPEESYRMPGGGGRGGAAAAIGENPPSGATIWFYLKDKPKGDIALEILDAAGKSVKKFSSRAPEGGDAPTGGGRRGGFGGPARVPAEKGLNRFAWDLRYPDATTFPGMILWAGNTSGPRAVPGNYQVKLTVDGKTLTETFEVRKDPRVPTTLAEFQKQFDLLVKIRDKFSETSEAITNIRDIKRQTDEYAKRVAGQAELKPIVDAAKALNDKLTAVEVELYQVKNQSGQDPLNYPIKLNNKIAALGGSVAGSDTQPTDQQVAVYEDLVARINTQLDKLKQVLAADVPAFNKLVQEKQVPAVFVKSAK